MVIRVDIYHKYWISHSFCNCDWMLETKVHKFTFGHTYIFSIGSFFLFFFKKVLYKKSILNWVFLQVIWSIFINHVQKITRFSDWYRQKIIWCEKKKILKNWITVHFYGKSYLVNNKYIMETNMNGYFFLRKYFD